MSTVQSPPRIVLGPHSAGMMMTSDEFDAVRDYDEEWRYELIHGVLVVSPMPLESEVDPNEELGHILRSYQEQHPHGSALDATLPERYSRTPDSRRRADRVIWAGLGRAPNPDEDVPAIAVEFVSAAKRDRKRDYIEKKKEYREAGIVEYWIIDRFQRIMTAIINKPRGSREVVTQEAGTYRTPLLPGFELKLKRLFSLADRW